jgi:hypothetical protein
MKIPSLQLQSIATIVTLLVILSGTVYKYSALSVTVDRHEVTLAKVEHHTADQKSHVSERDWQRYEELIQKVDKMDDKLDRLLEIQQQQQSSATVSRRAPSRTRQRLTADPNSDWVYPLQASPTGEEKKPEDVAGWIKRFFSKLD